MKVLIAFERSGVVRDAFRMRGHAAFSCDLEPSDTKTPYHHQEDARLTILHGWDLIIAHPPCTHLAVSGNRWYAGTSEREEAIKFVRELAELMTKHSDRWAIENPVGALSTGWRKPDQYVQPWMFGHGETKKTGLWLHNLPPLEPTGIVEGRTPRIHYMPPGPERSRLRSITYEGIANAMADQWV